MRTIIIASLLVALLLTGSAGAASPHLKYNSRGDDALEEVVSPFHVSSDLVQSYLRGAAKHGSGEDAMENAEEDAEEDAEVDAGDDGFESEEECRRACAFKRMCRARDCGPELEQECLREECGIEPEDEASQRSQDGTDEEDDGIDDDADDDTGDTDDDTDDTDDDEAAFESEEECRRACAFKRMCRARDCGPELEQECLRDECGIAPPASAEAFDKSRDGQNGKRKNRNKGSRENRKNGNTGGSSGETRQECRQRCAYKRMCRAAFCGRDAEEECLRDECGEPGPVFPVSEEFEMAGSEDLTSDSKDEQNVNSSENNNPNEGIEKNNRQTEEECRKACAFKRMCRARDCGPELEKECLRDECGISPPSEEVVNKSFHLSEEISTFSFEERTRSRKNKGNSRKNRDSATRDEDWLKSHNSERRKYHRQYGYSYVPLQWSTGLRDLAQSQANKNAQNCKNQLLSGTSYGQNIALKTGNSNARSTDDVVSSWMGRFDEGVPNNSATQVLWRATHYVGCADAAGSNCYASVCVYTKPGNCNMRKYGDDWETPTFADDSMCGDECPPEGCP